MSILFKNIAVLSGDSFVPCTNVLVEDDKFAYIGTKADITADRVIDGKDRLIIPGFVNTHSHVPMSFLRGYADGMELNEWLFEKIFPAEDKLTPDDTYWGTKLTLLEMLASGTTAFNDMYMFCDRIADATIESGMRAKISRGLQSWDAEGVDDSGRMAENMKLYSKYHGAADGRITVGFGMHSVYCCTPEYLRRCAEQIKELGGISHVHLSETATENANCLKDYGKTPARLMYDAGVFDTKCIAAHCVHLSDEDMALLAEKGVTAACNPASNLKLRSGISNPLAMKAAGMNIALGTDGSSSNNNVDMLEEMQLAALLYKMDAAEAFKMATVYGAKALGMDDVGEIKEGMKADFAVLRTDKPHFQPIHDVRANLVYAAKSADVVCTAVDGEILYENGEFKTLDAEKIIYEVNKTKQRICG